MLPRYSSGPIKDIEQLAKTLSYSVTELLFLINTHESERYSDPAKLAYKSDGSIRRIKNPSSNFRRIQGRINHRIIKTGIEWPPFLFGSIPKDSVNRETDYIECARKHVGAKSICKIDITNFFDNIHESYIYDMFMRLFRFPEPVSKALTNICCYEGTLVQGARTSSYIATLILWEEEENIVEKLAKKNLVYTRLIDDITISSKIANYNFDVPKKHIENMLLKLDLPVNPDKFKVQYTSMTPLEVHGLRVTYSSPTMAKSEMMNIKAAVHNLEMLAKTPNVRTEMWYRKDYNRCMGRVNKLSRIKSPRHKKFIQKLREIRPLPSYKDLKYSKIRLTNLKSDFKNIKKKYSYSYYKRFYLLLNRTNLIKLTYPDKALKIRYELDKIKPLYNPKDYK
ncbi:reverse transcriptase family protein [Pseudoalteromonas haloplanktis]|uniref:Reverse transcriptase family protein n=1 Tax=Pseudoalteromonas haloplanktis TaxID=228 RepID=A0ABU1BCD1_PSEHA|nr:reverse transcriptase family protein [Pseudoalteromonas haloplanktis]MDQ9091257.1 reverse transcriptase family protein [Pseudoalteromonas haloplanktis]